MEYGQEGAPWWAAISAQCSKSGRRRDISASCDEKYGECKGMERQKCIHSQAY